MIQKIYIQREREREGGTEEQRERHTEEMWVKEYWSNWHFVGAKFL